MYYNVYGCITSFEGDLRKIKSFSWQIKMKMMTKKKCKTEEKVATY
jgi:hypothetical protein